MAQLVDRPTPTRGRGPARRWLVAWAVLALVALALLVADLRSEDDASPPASPSPSASVAPDDHLVEPGRVGPFEVGADARDLAAAGLVVPDPAVACGNAWAPVEDTFETGVFLSFRRGDPDDLDQVLVKDPDAGGRSRYATAEGAGPGTTYAELEHLYGARLQHQRWPNEDGAGPSDSYTLFGADGALSFDFGGIVASGDARVAALVVSAARELAELEAPDLGC